MLELDLSQHRTYQTFVQHVSIKLKSSFSFLFLSVNQVEFINFKYVSQTAHFNLEALMLQGHRDLLFSVGEEDFSPPRAFNRYHTNFGNKKKKNAHAALKEILTSRS